VIEGLLFRLKSVWGLVYFFQQALTSFTFLVYFSGIFLPIRFMSILSHITHHATLFVHNDRKTFAHTLWNELRGNSLAHILHEHTVLDIDTARALTSWANTPYEGEKVALLSFHTITLPAQNALLKILEEPRMGVRFILVTSNREALLPTFFSRLQYQEEGETSKEHNEAKKFLATKPEERMKLPYIVSLLATKDEEDRKDREGVRTFIISLISELDTATLAPHYALTTLEFASYAGDPSSSGKNILEYLALLLPQTKV